MGFAQGGAGGLVSEALGGLAGDTKEVVTVFLFSACENLIPAGRLPPNNSPSAVHGVPRLREISGLRGARFRLQRQVDPGGAGDLLGRRSRGTGSRSGHAVRAAHGGRVLGRRFGVTGASARVSGGA